MVGDERRDSSKKLKSLSLPVPYGTVLYYCTLVWYSCMVLLLSTSSTGNVAHNRINRSVSTEVWRYVRTVCADRKFKILVQTYVHTVPYLQECFVWNINTKSRYQYLCAYNIMLTSSIVQVMYRHSTAPYHWEESKEPGKKYIEWYVRKYTYCMLLTYVRILCRLRLWYLYLLRILYIL